MSRKNRDTSHAQDVKPRSFLKSFPQEAAAAPAQATQQTQIEDPPHTPITADGGEAAVLDGLGGLHPDPAASADPEVIDQTPPPPPQAQQSPPEAPVSSQETFTPPAPAHLSDKELRALYARTLRPDMLAAWDRDTLRLYHEKKVQPAKTLRGNWPIDIRRSADLSQWHIDELLDWVDGLLVAPKPLTPDLIWDELYRRKRLPGNWPIAAAKHFILTGRKPPYTRNGVLIDDRARNAKPIAHWTYLEIRSALLNEIPTSYTQLQLLEQLRVRMGLNPQFSGERLLKHLSSMPTEATVDNTLLKSQLDEYKTVMTKSGSNLTDVTAGQAQVILATGIRQVMKRDYVDFQEGWNIILDFFNENYSQLFTPEKARRGWNKITLAKSQLAAYEDLMTLIIQTRDPVGRNQNAKLYNMQQILRHVISEKERVNVVTFYNS